MHNRKIIDNPKLLNIGNNIGVKPGLFIREIKRSPGATKLSWYERDQNDLTGRTDEVKE